MVNLADLDTSFLVPCRHCGDLLPEQDRICPHCGKDQSVASVEGGAGPGVGSPGLPPGGGAASDRLAMAHGARDFTRAGIGARAVDEGARRRRRKAIGIVALLAGVLLLGMAYDRYAKQGATSPTVPTPTSTSAREGPPAASRPAATTGPVVRTPSSAAAPVASPSTAPPPSMPPSTTPTPPKESAPAATEPTSSGCSEALAALSLCAKP